MFDKLKKRFGGQITAPPSTAPVVPSPIVDVTDAGFAATVQTPRLVVVDFWAEWCQPCQVMSAYVGFLAKDYAEHVLVAALDADENLETPQRFQIMGLPTLLFLHDGEEVDRIVGVVPYEEIKARVEHLLASL
ncbi:MAG: thioredoxin family protein [Caldilinea sp.]